MVMDVTFVLKRIVKSCELSLLFICLKIFSLLVEEQILKFLSMIKFP